MYCKNQYKLTSDAGSAVYTTHSVPLYTPECPRTPQSAPERPRTPQSTPEHPRAPQNAASSMHHLTSPTTNTSTICPRTDYTLR